MIKRISAAAMALLVSVGAGFAQTADSVETSGSTMVVFYSFQNGEVRSESNTNWDMSFEITGFASGIHINAQAGCEVFVSPFTVDQWASFDSTGMGSWEQSHNGHESWSEGAFNTNLTSEFDLGWGTYDINSHAVKGDTVYLLKTRNDVWKKIYIKSLASSKYTIVYADVDGSNEMEKVIDKGDYSAANFAYFDFATGMDLNREPAKTDWDIVFTKYVLPIPAGPDVLYYGVSGVKINKNYENVQREGVDVMSDDTSTLVWNTNVSEIGSDWKTFNRNTNVYDITADNSYFVRTATGAVWKIYFTKFEGMGSGTFWFNTKNIRGAASLREITENVNVIYPNPVSSSFSVQTESAIAQVQLIDIEGRVIGNWSDVQEVYDISNVANGTYFVLISTDQGTSVNRIQKN